MPFLEIPAAWVVAGKPTKEEIFQYIRDNQASFNADIEALKQTSTIDIIDVKISGDISHYTESQINERLPVFKAPLTGTITSVVVTILTGSTSGTLQVDIEKSTDNGVNWSSLLTSPVEENTSTVGNVSGAVNFINAAAQDFNQNDLLRIVIPQIQINQGEFHVSIYGELA